MDDEVLPFECKMHRVKQLTLFSEHWIDQEVFCYFHSFITIIWSYGSKYIPIGLLHRTVGIVYTLRKTIISDFWTQSALTCTAKFTTERLLTCLKHVMCLSSRATVAEVYPHSIQILKDSSLYLVNCPCIHSMCFVMADFWEGL